MIGWILQIKLMAFCRLVLLIFGCCDLIPWIEEMVKQQTWACGLMFGDYKARTPLLLQHVHPKWRWMFQRLEGLNDNPPCYFDVLFARVINVV